MRSQWRRQAHGPPSRSARFHSAWTEFAASTWSNRLRADGRAGGHSPLVRGRADARRCIGRYRCAAREAVASLDRRLPLANVQTLRQFEWAVLGERRFQLILIASFAVASLLLAGSGPTACSPTPSRRAREIAIRLALASSPTTVRAMVVRQGHRPVLSGLAFGLAVALLSGRLVAGLLFGVEPTDPATMLTATAVMLAAAMLACWIPARRVMHTSLLSVLSHG